VARQLAPRRRPHAWSSGSAPSADDAQRVSVSDLSLLPAWQPVHRFRASSWHTRLRAIQPVDAPPIHGGGGSGGGGPSAGPRPSSVIWAWDSNRRLDGSLAAGGTAASQWRCSHSRPAPRPRGRPPLRTQGCRGATRLPAQECYVPRVPNAGIGPEHSPSRCDMASIVHLRPWCNSGTASWLPRSAPARLPARARPRGSHSRKAGQRQRQHQRCLVVMLRPRNHTVAVRFPRTRVASRSEQETAEQHEPGCLRGLRVRAKRARIPNPMTPTSKHQAPES